MRLCFRCGGIYPHLCLITLVFQYYAYYGTIHGPTINHFLVIIMAQLIIFYAHNWYGPNFGFIPYCNHNTQKSTSYIYDISFLSVWVRVKLYNIYNITFSHLYWRPYVTNKFTFLSQYYGPNLGPTFVPYFNTAGLAVCFGCTTG